MTAENVEVIRRLDSSLPPVSARVKKNTTAVIARFVCRSPSSIQNQVSR